MDLKNITMASNNTTTTLSDHMSVYYDKVFLERAKAVLVYAVGAQVKKIARNSGKTVKWNRMSPLALVTSGLTEGTTPSSVAMSTTVVSATAVQYGAYTQTSDFYELTSIDEGLKEQTDVMGQNAGESIKESVDYKLSLNTLGPLNTGLLQYYPV